MATELKELINRPTQGVEDGILSVLPEADRQAHYDKIAWAYDTVISSWLYNRLLWGNTPSDYEAFAAEGLEEASGPILDAGCGSLVFTERTYAASSLPILLMDRSIGMLRRARSRLSGDHPRVLLQADLYDLPFPDKAFDRVFSFAIAHVLDDRTPVFRNLLRVLRPGGRLHLTSIVTGNGSRLGDRWARLLHRRGELARPYPSEQLVHELESVGFECTVRLQGSGAYVSATKTDS